MGNEQAEPGKQPSRTRGAWVSAGPFLPLYYAIRARADLALRWKYRRQRALVLTYDDGPGTQVTPPLMELLGSYRAHATFFMMGRRAEQYPEIVDSLKRAGHDIGVHTYSHLHPWKVPASKALADIDDGYAALARWTPPDALFRPPHGKLTWATWTALRRRNAPLCWWTLDSGDTWAELPSTHAVVEGVARSHGGVVLMHDFDRDAGRAGFVLETTRRLLDTANDEGLNVMALSGLLLRG